MSIPSTSQNGDSDRAAEKDRLVQSDIDAIAARVTAYNGPRDTLVADPSASMEQAHRIASVDVPALIAEVERYRSALGYISSPTIGWPGDGDLLDFAEHRATDTNARLALLACIRTARQALGR